nr:hypothetical protein [Tanacetum cinerariifolium]
MLLCKQAEQGVPLQAEQYDWLADTDEEVDKQELEAHYSFITKIQEVPNADSGTDSKPVEQVQNDIGYNVFANALQHSEQSESVSNTCLVETNDSNVTPGNLQQALKDKGVIDSGCSRHLTKNISYLFKFEEINGGYVAFGGNPKGGKITSEGKLDFDDLYFVKEIKFNLFSVSQMCDKKNNILFTDTKCVLLSFDFKLPDKNHVLLRVPRKNNMYNVDLKNIVPSGDLTALFAKATLDEGLPSKVFENNHTCIACKKGKKHRASCKTKHVSSVSQPLQRLHMDLFGPTFVKSLNKKSYRLVVTDDYSMFSWVFFLATKDETSSNLRTFITDIENQINPKVKLIRSDNGTEFKNHDLNQFYGMKGIKREFSVARTPQQNRVAERKNRTLIEAAKAMLADSLLPIPFWAGAVNTVCYVQNRVLVTKPNSKIPYELLLGRTPSIGFMRPFGCHVTILNTLDPLGKFDRKVDKGFLVGYSVNSKAFRVFNRSGPTWLFDIDTLTQSINYQSVVTGNQPNSSAGIQENLDAGKVGKEPVSTQQYVLLPLWSTSSKDSQNIYVDAALLINRMRVKVNAASTPVTAVGPNSTNNTNSFNAADPFNTAVSPTFEIGRKFLFVDPSRYPNDPNMPALEDIIYSDDEEDVGAKADFSNLETSITSMRKVVKDQGGLTQINNEDFHTGMFAYFLSQEEPKRVHQALKDPSWIEVMQNELLQFKMQNVWELCTAFEKLMKGNFQMSSIGELTFFLRLQVKQKQDRIFISQDKYVAEILRKYGFTDVKSTSTPIEIEKPLLKDPNVKRIFRYLKGKPHLGLWYPRDSPFNLVAYYDSDYAGASLDRKSITGDSKSVAGLWQFWTSVSIKKTNDVVRLQALIDREKVIIAEDTIRQALQLDDVDGVNCLLKEEIFAELVRMGYEKPSTKLTFYKASFSDQWKFLIHTFSSRMMMMIMKYLLNLLHLHLHMLLHHHHHHTKNLSLLSLQAESTQPSSPPQQQPSQTTDISMTLLNTLLETCATLTKKVANLEQDKLAQAIEIIKHKQRVKSMQDFDEAAPAKVEEVIEVVTAAKLMTDVVTTAATTITAAQVPKASAPWKRKGVIIQDPEETATTSVIVYSEVKSKDKGKEAELNANINWNDVMKQSRRRGHRSEGKEGSKGKGENLNHNAAKKQRIDEETEELKTHLQIVPNDDDVYTKATPLALKRRFRDALEASQKRFQSSMPKNFSDDFLLNTLKIMFKKPNVKASIWRDQRGRYGLAKVKS